MWKHYNIREGKHFPDGKDRAYCKYCNGGPIDANSSNGMSNFKHHMESCSARSSTDVGQLMMAKVGNWLASVVDLSIKNWLHKP